MVICCGPGVVLEGGNGVLGGYGGGLGVLGGGVVKDIGAWGVVVGIGYFSIWG